jgi:hypothetical protein
MQRTAVVTEPKVGSVVYLDPRGHVHSVDRQMARRLGDVTGAVAALLDNVDKARGQRAHPADGGRGGLPGGRGGAVRVLHVRQYA